jgi:hypothetical protein
MWLYRTRLLEDTEKADCVQIFIIFNLNLVSICIISLGLCIIIVLGPEMS